MLSGALESEVFDSAVILSPPYDPLLRRRLQEWGSYQVDRTEDLE